MSQPKPESDPSPSLPEKPSVSVSDSDHSHSSDYAPYPKLGPDDTAPALPDDWASRSAGPEPRAPISVEASTTLPPESNPYVSPAPAPVPASASVKNKIGSVKEVIGNLGKKAAEATKMAEDLAGNMWQHLKTGPSVTDAAVGRITQGTKVLTEGGYEKIFRQTFEVVPDEQLVRAYACYLFTSTGPIMGTLYLSTAKLAFCSDKPLSFKENEQTQWCYYKVVLPINQLKAVNPSTSKINPAEKYIQVISLDNHEFWFMGFVSYDSAVKKLQEVLQHSSSTGSAHHETLVP